MNKLKPLIMMQLKDKIDLSFLRSKKQTMFKVIFAILGFALVLALSYVLFYVSQLLHLFSLVAVTPISVVVVIITITQILSIISCSVGLMKSFYFSPDNPVLLTMPVSSMQVFLSKFIVYFLNELMRNFYFLFPILVAYGMTNGYGFGYYPWLIFCIIFLSMLPVVIGAFLSIPAMLVSIFLKRFRLIEIILLVGVVGGLILLLFKGISLIPENIDLVGQWGMISNRIQDFLRNFSATFVPFAWLTQFVVGSRSGFTLHLLSIDTLYIFLGILGVIVVMLGASLLIVKPLFLKMSCKSFEYRRKTILHAKKDHKRGAFASSLMVDFKRNLRTSSILSNTIIVFFMLPIAIFFFDKILSSMNTRLLGQHMSYSFNLLLILLIVLANNTTLASVYSKEGLAGLLNKTRPVKPITILLPKLIWQIAFSSVSVVITIIIFQTVLPIKPVDMLLFILIVLCLNLGHMLWSAELDFMNPMFQMYQTFGESSANSNETKSTISAFGIAFLMFGLSLFLFEDNYNLAWVKLFALSLAFAVWRVWSFGAKQNIYYKEKV